MLFHKDLAQAIPTIFSIQNEIMRHQIAPEKIFDSKIVYSIYF